MISGRVCVSTSSKINQMYTALYIYFRNYNCILKYKNSFAHFGHVTEAKPIPEDSPLTTYLDDKLYVT